MITFKEFVENDRIKKIRVEVPESMSERASGQLNEATRVTVGKSTARRDQPHFQGDEYHAHVELPGGYEVAWGQSGKRRHSNKFPATVPADARAAVAKVLGVSTDLLEAYKVFDEKIGENVYLIEVKDEEI